MQSCIFLLHKFVRGEFGKGEKVGKRKEWEKKSKSRYFGKGEV